MRVSHSRRGGRAAMLAIALLVTAVIVAASVQNSSESDPPTPTSPPRAADEPTNRPVPPRCFGAVSMTRERCRDHAPTDLITPEPSRANRDRPKIGGKQCYRSGTDQTEMNRGCTFGVRAEDRPHVILVGDSHGRALLPAFIAMAEKGTISLEAQVRGGCSWTRSDLEHPDRSRIAPCTTYRANLERWLVRQAPRTDVVVTTGYVRQIAGKPADQVRKMRAAWQPVIEQGVRIVAISDNPRLPHDPQRCLSKHGPHEGATVCGVSVGEGLVADPFLRTARSTRGAEAIDLRSSFCRDGHCPAVIGGVNVYRDRTHLTATFASTLAPILAAGLS